MSIESVMPSNYLVLCRPLFLLPSIFPSIRVFSNESVLCIRRPQYWSFSFSISPSREYSGLISFKIDWLDLLAVPETLKSVLQHHSLKESIPWGFPLGSDGQAFTYNAGDLDLISKLERCPGGVHGNPLHYSCLENSHGEESGQLQSMGSQRIGHN